MFHPADIAGMSDSEFGGDEAVEHARGGVGDDWTVRTEAMAKMMPSTIKPVQDDVVQPHCGRYEDDQRAAEQQRHRRTLGVPPGIRRRPGDAPGTLTLPRPVTAGRTPSSPTPHSARVSEASATPQMSRNSGPSGPAGGERRTSPCHQYRGIAEMRQSAWPMRRISPMC